jgi:hypothetical protein
VLISLRMLKITSKGLTRAVLLTLFFGVLSAQSASANPILWSLVGVTFDDGGTAYGSFVYDADTNTYSNISITTTAGSAFGGATYTLINDIADDPTASGIYLVTSVPATPGLPGLIMGFFNLTNAGGTISPPNFGISEGTIYDNPRALLQQRSNLALVGGLTSVPEPSTFILSTIPLGALAFFALKRRNRTS